MELRSRSNDRCVWRDDQGELTSELWVKLQPFVPATLYNGEWILHSVNNIFRFYRYKEGGEFKPHFDNVFRNGDIQSHFSLLIYLNDDFEGGKTLFFSWKPSGAKYEAQHVQIEPKTGYACIFPHTGNLSPLHSGLPHTTPGHFKYVIRSDIMYKRLPSTSF
uniref:Fe2OG dioxygenase domain-containing protein n=1 Tax=Arcella intermedia TaxID=1963864 RepID=A0A6B2LJK0_9EUKA